MGCCVESNVHVETVRTKMAYALPPRYDYAHPAYRRVAKPVLATVSVSARLAVASRFTLVFRRNDSDWLARHALPKPRLRRDTPALLEKRDCSVPGRRS
jgi:hypothetical protein